MPDNNANLSIGVGLDLSKLRMDAEVAKAELRKASRDLTKAANSQVAGTGDAAATAAATAEVMRAEKSMLAVRAATAAAGVEARTLRDRLKEGVEHLEKMHGHFEGGAGMASGGISGMFGGIAKMVGQMGPAGWAIGGVTAAIGGGFYLMEHAAEEAHRLSALSNALGISTGQMRAWDDAARHAGVNAELYAKTVERIAINAAKAAEEQKKLTNELASEVLKDAGGMVARGGRSSKPTPLRSELISPLPRLGDTANYAIDRTVNEIMEANEKARALNPAIPRENAETLRFRLRNEARESEKTRSDLEKMTGGGKIPVGSTSEMLARMKPGFYPDEFTKMGVQVVDVTNKLKDMGRVMSLWSVGRLKLEDGERLKSDKAIGGKGMLDPFLQGHFTAEGKAGGGAYNTPESEDHGIEAGHEVGLFLKGIEAKLHYGMVELGLKEAEAAKATIATISSTAETITQTWNDVSGTVTGALSGVAKAADGAATAMSKIGKGGGDGGELLGNAAGGYIHGPGTGTSDSIIARVSNGEFVVNAASTSRNLALLHSINNGYAMGGLVGFPRLPGFAEGGAVGRSPVHLHLDGHEYRMSASEGVAGQLVAHAHSQRTRSAGAKPSWFGG